MKFFRSKKATGFTLVEIMIVVLIIGILLAIAIPNFVSARESSRAKACVGNLKQIDTATQQYCMDQKLSAANYGTGPTLATLVGPSAYIRITPSCPEAGTYVVAPTITDSPYCSISGTSTNKSVVAAGNTDTNYASGAKFYHGL